jgi:prepilin-type N-terminal cleavage/methylation domain-containing protein
MRRRTNPHRRSLDAFSLVEVLAAVTIIGVIIFLAIPNIIKIREDSEQSLAKSRASALNIAAASYFQARGPTDALAAWADQSTASRYDLIKNYLRTGGGQRLHRRCFLHLGTRGRKNRRRQRRFGRGRWLGFGLGCRLRGNAGARCNDFLH